MGDWERPPAMLAGRYRLEELIGRGETGEVWRGHDLRPGWPVAVKILSPRVADISMRERFAREARTAARVVHPNVVTVFDVGEHEGRPFLVMELLTGRDLATELAENGPLSVPAMCRLAGQAALGLDAAHRAGVVHRDVTPANLHQSADGVLKVVDFGTARVATEAAVRLTSGKSGIGTAAYLSPEQVLGGAGNAASDLYALGCVCYELLCGRPPFTGPATELAAQHVHNRPDPPSRYRPDVPAELERLVLALLEKDPAARPASGEVVRRVLADVARHATPRVHDTAAHRVHESAVSRGSGVEASRAHDTVRPRGHEAAPLRAPGAEAPRTHETAVFPVPDLGPAAEPGAPGEPRAAGPVPGRLRRWHAGAALGVVAVLVAGALWTSAPSDPVSSVTTVAVPSGTPSAPRSPSPTASRSAAPSPAPSRTRPSPRSAAEEWRARLLAFGRAVTDQERRGGIDPKLARKVREKIAKIARKIQEGKNGDVRDELRELGRDLVKARREGRLASEGPLIAFLRESGVDLTSRGRHSDDDDD
ncbi:MULTISPECIES: serine/threonine-protein kinase [Streptosporangium]|uniref:non-specific serine/threonine protein kinase n=1 Tax=Streptosporangium brasiliense TaxID=47480 RepID=A0ABT9QWZ6_9ACTN|nr:serine/threonine-protein kinase [Streptosporangium brasiliense]MDP9861498.1 serine/threonine-protein kinase [Streptosporangium brasiliense]